MHKKTTLEKTTTTLPQNWWCLNRKRCNINHGIKRWDYLRTVH